ncbi:GNAT family N-acetyltransferase [Roseibium sp. RKSG952]|uniref:GNAT family N-acetyltransferase n=1 Tax=Roseibium sp. RKSG952 TaxID=2529384 RepID=UPI0018AD2A4B
MQSFSLVSGSNRLLPLEPSDASDLEELLTQARLCSLNGMTDRNVDADACRQRLSDVLKTRITYGLQTWKIVDEADVPVGVCGFSVAEETSEINLFYCFTARAMGRDPDLARRVCRDVIDSFFRATYFTHLICTARRGDHQLQRHLETLGFAYRETRQIGRHLVDVHQVLSPVVAQYLEAG